jgi:hypothetical protein
VQLTPLEAQKRIVEKFIIFQVIFKKIVLHLRNNSWQAYLSLPFPFSLLPFSHHP